ncbi:MAG: hypothetical protein JRG83_09525, partial [Deltaproteobacteria bacterium]|nr:hypothetical protein [Deltaproteobacteria bacterium]
MARRTITSCRKSMKCRRACFSVSVSGRPLTSASRLTPKVDCSDAHALAVRLVAQVGHAVDLAVAYEVGDPLEQRALVHHERDLGDDDPAPPALGLLEVGGGTHGEQAAARRIGLADPFAPTDRGARREVGAGHLLEQIVERAVRVVRFDHQRVDQLAH